MAFIKDKCQKDDEFICMVRVRRGLRNLGSRDVI